RDTEAGTLVSSHARTSRRNRCCSSVYVTSKSIPSPQSRVAPRGLVPGKVAQSGTMIVWGGSGMSRRKKSRMLVWTALGVQLAGLIIDIVWHALHSGFEPTT